MPRITGADSLNIVQSWVDASYTIHPDMRGYTGCVTPFGHEVTHTKCSKQKMNTKSSTEPEVVGDSDYLAHTVWLSDFMKYQGYPISREFFYQDNMSAIQIEKNGNISSSERSRHINIGFFYIKDILKREGIEVKHYPKERMIVDLITKPLKGKLFKWLRDIVMGLALFPTEERVGLYDDSSKKSIVEECVPEVEKSEVNKCQPSLNKVTWDQIVITGNT